ncbi:hypothetical protein [Methylobacterium sp. A54F]
MATRAGAIEAPVPRSAAPGSAALPSSGTLPRAWRGTLPRAWRRTLPRTWPVLALLGLALLPVLATPVPAMVDYPNHLARMYLLARDGGPEAHPLYRVAWALYPNLAMDLIVPALARLVGVEAAARWFLVASQILVVSGAVAIEVAVKGRHALSGYAGVLMLYSLPFAWGFVNFEFGLGLALWGIALWLRLGPRMPWLRLAAHAGFVVLLAAAHLFALGLYGFTLGVHELWRARAARPGRRAVLAAVATLAGPALLVLGLMRLGGGSVGGAGSTWHLDLKALWPFLALNGYSAALSGLGGIALLCLGAALARRGALLLTGPGPWLAAAFAALYAAMPWMLLDTAFVDIRVIVAATLILPAFLTVTFPDRRWQRAAGALVVGLTLASIATTAAVWTSYRDDFAGLTRAFARMEPGARLLIGHSGEALDPPLADLAGYPIYHAPVLAVAYADAFVPTLFTATGKQPIAAGPRDAGLALPYGGPVPVARLVALAQGPAPAGTPAFLRNWLADYAYLCVVGPPAPNPLPARLAAVAAGPRFTLYRVRPELR